MPVRYSPRQSHCLRHMGLTPWVDRHVVPDRLAPDVPAVDSAAVPQGASPVVPPVGSVGASGAEPVHETDAAVESPSAPGTGIPGAPASSGLTPMPGTPDSLPDWLRAQSLLAVSGPVVHGEPALVSLVFPGAADAARDCLPEQGASARLLNDMLRSIGLRRRDVSLWRPCAGDTNANATSVRLDGASLLAGTGICLLVSELPIEGESATSHCLDSEAALYLLPHPAALQREPARKRAAWNVLKQVRVQLDALTSSAGTSG